MAGLVLMCLLLLMSLLFIIECYLIIFVMDSLSCCASQSNNTLFVSDIDDYRTIVDCLHL